MKINLSDSEWKLMNHLWAASPQTITELTAGMSGETGWTKNTIITMLSRLEHKGGVLTGDEGEILLGAAAILMGHGALVL